MPTSEWMNAFMIGAVFGALLVFIPCRYAMRQSHLRSMETYDRCRDLLSDKFDLFRDVHHGAMKRLRERRKVGL